MRILVLYTGGVPFFKDATAKQINKIFEGYLELNLMTEINVQVVSDSLGADAKWETAARLGQIVNEQYKNYDGFVAIHGIDNAIYIANLFTFLFSALGKPVVFTGCSLPDDVIRIHGEMTPKERQTYNEIELRTNMVTAVQLATLDCSGTFLAFGPRIVRAVHAIESTGVGTEQFRSWKEAGIAEVQFGIHFSEKIAKRHDAPIDFVPTFAREIVIIHPYPEMALPEDVERTHRGVLIRAYDEQPIPSTLQLPERIPVIIHARRDVPLDVNKKNTLFVANATFPVTLTKMMATLGRTDSLATFMEIFKHNRFGEFT